MLKYHPNRILFSIIFLIVIAMAFAWDRSALGLSTMIGWLAELASTANLEWLSAFLSRVSGLTAGMLVALIIILAFACLQLTGAIIDGRVLRDVWGIPLLRRIMAALSGRPGKLYKSINQSKVLETHFSYGRDSLLGPLRLAQWAFPVVGFIGTVIGVSGAVKNLPNALEDEAALDSVLANLHTAFDTTFVGLAASVIVMMAIYFLDNIWDRNQFTSSHSELLDTTGQSDERT